MKRGHITAFYLETLLLILVFLALVLVLTRMFGLSRVQSSAAEKLSSAVALSEKAAEAVSASGSPEEVAALLNEGSNAQLVNGKVEAGYNADMSPNSTRAPEYWVMVRWEPEADGRLARCRISVQPGDPWDPTPIYVLDTAVYLGEVTP